MNAQIYKWELPLVSMAQRAIGAYDPEIASPRDDRALLHAAYRHCERVTALHSRSFHLASRLLPRAERRAVRALYAFCRTTDDIVDHPLGNAEATLRQWRKRALPWEKPNDDLASIAWADTCQRYRIPRVYAEQFIDGVARDLYQNRYETFDDLAAYCYGVASTVGLMSMHIVGYTREEAFVYAIRLGVALQMTNILRDVGEDWRRGRLYLPLEELRAYGLSEADIATGEVDDRWRAFMQFQISRVRRLYSEALPGIALLARDGRLAIAAAADLYSGILEEIQAGDFDVFSRRARVSDWQKISRLPRLWWKVRRLDGTERAKV